MAQNGDLNLNVSPDVARQLRAAGLINDSQYGAIAEGGRARFSFADNDLLVSSSTGFTQSARSDTSTKYEAGKQAGPDTVEHMLSSGPERSEEHTSELQSLMRISYAVFCLKKKKTETTQADHTSLKLHKDTLRTTQNN